MRRDDVVLRLNQISTHAPLQQISSTHVSLEDSNKRFDNVEIAQDDHGGKKSPLLVRSVVGQGKLAFNKGMGKKVELSDASICGGIVYDNPLELKHTICRISDTSQRISIGYAPN